MKLALLGDDDEAIALVRAAIDSGRHELVWAGDFADRRRIAEILQEALRVERDDWESLAGGAADAVIVATSRDAQRRADQLRLLVQSGVAVCVTNCGALGPIVCYELDMNRAETQTPLVPFLADRRHPAIERIAEWITEPGNHPVLGTIQQIVIERGADDKRAASVLQGLARDVDLVRAILGDVTRISAAGVTPGDASPERDFSALNVYLATQRPMTVRWAIDRQLPPRRGRITLDGELGRAVVSIDGDCWTLSIDPRGSDSPAGKESFAPWRPADLVLANLEAAIDGRDFAPGWLDAARAADVADMVEVSLRRGRTIDMYNETYSEQGTFKGVMGIAGCGLILLALFTLLGAAIGQKTARFLRLEWLAAAFGHWHYGLLAVLVAFLLLQLLRFVVPATPKPPASDEKSP
ncbi:MAG: hypothetical protein WD875_05745 [Pirellulales bacterium]